MQVDFDDEDGRISVMTIQEDGTVLTNEQLVDGVSIEGAYYLNNSGIVLQNQGQFYAIAFDLNLPVTVMVNSHIIATNKSLPFAESPPSEL